MYVRTAVGAAVVGAGVGPGVGVSVGAGVGASVAATATGAPSGWRLVSIMACFSASADMNWKLLLSLTAGVGGAVRGSVETTVVGLLLGAALLAVAPGVGVVAVAVLSPGVVVGAGVTLVMGGRVCCVVGGSVRGGHHILVVCIIYK